MFVIGFIIGALVAVYVPGATATIQGIVTTIKSAVSYTRNS